MKGVCKWKAAGLLLGWAAFPAGSAWSASLAGHALDWPSGAELLRVLTLQDYNTRVVIVGAALLGLAAGLIGTFLLLRKRALLSDVLSHATLPGIALAFMLMTALWGYGKHLLGLIAGAAVFAVLGTGCVVFIQRYSRLKDDAALGIVLSVFFGLGVALLGVATRMESGDAAGLSSFIYGKTASMLFSDALLIGIAALACIVFCLAFFKEFSLLCFDAPYASTLGWPVGRLDFLMMALVVIVTVIGLQAVGLILVVALLIIPPSAARFWTDRLRSMLWLSGAFGAASGLIGAGISALMANLPAGAVIVLTASVVFVISLTFGTARGLVRMGLERRRLSLKIHRENLLRELYEWFENRCGPSDLVDSGCRTLNAPRRADLLSRRAWAPGHFKRALRELHSKRLVTESGSGGYGFTPEGLAIAQAVVRKHRLWEAYLITHADTAPGQVDWGADEIEHVLDKEMIASLEQLLPVSKTGIPRSPHRMSAAEGSV
jgi:manganese/zinc/iron transport system permease protein